MLRHGMESFASPDVLRFLGHRVRPDRRLAPRLAMDVTSDCKQRPEGVRRPSA